MNKGSSKLKVLIVDDSAFSRQTIKMMLEKSPEIEVVGIAFDGKDGINKILKLKPDAVSLDIEMPEMSGFALLQWIMKENPIPVIVVSAHRDDATVFKALELGAVDFISKPTGMASRELENIEEDVLKKFSSLSFLRMEKIKNNISLLERSKIEENYCKIKTSKVEVIAIGASTGGPTALQSIITQLPADLPASVMISQHMPAGFTKQFTERMNKLSAIEVSEAVDGEPLMRGHVYVCPGDHHFMLHKSWSKTLVHLKKASPGDHYVPSIDTMMKSAAKHFGPKVMGIILTGMGNDGKAGMREIKSAGGITIAESEETSVIYGMPREVVISGSADKILRLENIPEEIISCLNKE
jgi:two-component system chemotaxis response regulator CheB